jgi:MFS family permease
MDTPNLVNLVSSLYFDLSDGEQRMNTHRVILVVSYAFAVVMMGAAIPTPLYPIYRHEINFSVLVVTFIFAAYPVGVLIALLLLGDLSDQVGRRRALLLALAVSVTSTLVFILVGGRTGGLLGARVLSGLSVGFTTGSASAYLAELYPVKLRTRASLLATMTTLGGVAIGPLLAGMLAQYAPLPTLVPYFVFLVALLPATGLILVPEKSLTYDRFTFHVQRLALPDTDRAAFAAAAAAGFAAFTLLGLMTALAPTLLRQVLDTASHAIAGLAVFLLYTVATASQPLATRLSTRAAMLIGLGLLPAGFILLLASLSLTSPALFVAGGVLGGSGVGFAFKTSLETVGRLAPDARRGEVMSSFFVACYLGLGLPVVGVGVILGVTSAFKATLLLAVCVTVISFVAAMVVWNR